MPLIEGIGDEVVQFMGVMVVIVVAALAWWSTNARPDHYRTVLVMRSRAHHPVTVSIRARAITNRSANTAAQSSIQAAATSPPGVVASEPTEQPRETARVMIPIREMDSIVDADMAMLDNNRLHFYRRMDSPNSTQNVAETTNEESETSEEAEPASNAQIREMDSIVSAMEADVSNNCDFFNRPNESSPSSDSTDESKRTQKDDNKGENPPSAASSETVTEEPVITENAAGDQGTSNDVTDGVNRAKILIKLKYLNDDLKEVEGSLDELLKDFKLRHFSTELSSENRVRLIFNGRVLVDEAATLRACGLHDRAVVHCLVHPKRNNNQRGAPEEAPMNATHELITEGARPERAWDLENILMTLVSVALTVVWFFRCEYSNMFTASASVALFGLTVFYSVAIFGLYLSDTFHLDRRPATMQVAQLPVNN